MLQNFLLTVESEEPSLIKELWDSIVNKYFTIEFGEYQNINLSNPMFSAKSILICCFIGILLASVLAIFNKRVLGDFVRACARDGATSPEKARTLAELGFLKNSAVRGALKRGGSLRRAVRCVEDDVADLQAGIPLHEKDAARYPYVAPAPKNTKITPTRTDLNHAHFYIPEDEIYTAEIRYDKKGTNWLGFFGALVLGLVVLSLIFRLLPDIMQLVDNFVGMVKPSSNIT
ncbi:MAG: hypothetical protein IJF49_01860 [Clostridia bacterium]|nr:hypothetical protein [Clostridia bacterium]